MRGNKVIDGTGRRPTGLVNQLASDVVLGGGYFYQPQHNTEDYLWGDDSAFDQGNSLASRERLGRILPVSHQLDVMTLPESEPSLDDFENFGQDAFESNIMPSPPLTTTPIADTSSPDTQRSPLSVAGDNDVDAVGDEPLAESRRRTKPSRRKRATQADSNRRDSHSRAERRYRETLQTGLEKLRQVVPAMSETDGSSRIPKAGVLFSAVRHIRSLERERASLAERNDRLAAEIIRMRRGAEAMRKEMAFVHSVYGPSWQHTGSGG